MCTDYNIFNIGYNKVSITIQVHGYSKPILSCYYIKADIYILIVLQSLPRVLYLDVKTLFR